MTNFASEWLYNREQLVLHMPCSCCLPEVSSCVMCTIAYLSLHNPQQIDNIMCSCAGCNCLLAWLMCAVQAVIYWNIANPAAVDVDIVVIAYMYRIHVTLPHGLGTVAKCTCLAPVHWSGVRVYRCVVMGCQGMQTILHSQHLMG